MSSSALLQNVFFKSFCKYSDEGLKGKISSYNTFNIFYINRTASQES